MLPDIHFIPSNHRRCSLSLYALLCPYWGELLWSGSAPIYFSISLTLYITWPLCHLIDHLTFWSHDFHYCSYCLLSHSPLSTLLGDAYCSTPLLFLFTIVSPYCLDPYCSLGSIVRPFRMLSQVAALVVYKLYLYHRRGPKPNLIYQSKCYCFHQTCVPLSSFTSYLFGLSYDPLRLSLPILSSLQDVCLRSTLQGITVITKGASPLWSSASPDPPCTSHLKAIGP